MKPLYLLPCAVALAACSHKVPEPQATPPSDTASARAATPWDGMKKDEQRAREVGEAAARRAGEEDRRIEQATQ